MEKEKSTKLLEELLNFIELGYNINKAIESLLEFEKDKSVRKTLMKIHEYSIETGEPIDMLLSEKVISSIEGTILRYAESPKDAIETILDNRNQISSLEFSIIKTIAPMFITLLILLSLVVGTKEPILNFMDGFLKKILGGSDYQKPDLPMYFDSSIQMVAQGMIYIIIFLVIVIPIWYIYNLYFNNKGLKTINKFFNIRSTFDSLKFLDLMYKINSTTGLSILQILEILSEEHPNKNIKTMLLEAKTKMDEGENFYEVLNEWNFDKQIVNIIEVGERTSNTWKSISKIPKFSEGKINAFLTNIKRRISFFKMLANIMLLFVGLEIMMIVIALQQLIMGAL